jgi:hypothetical protein
MKFAVASAWPEVKNAEYECIERIKISAKNIGAECIVVDNEGYIIGENDKRTDIYLNGDEVEFVIALHFVTEKLYDCYMYGAMWNPPKFLMDWDYNVEAIKYFTYDDYLIYNSKKIVAHLDNLLSSTNKDLSNAIHFVPSVPGDVMRPKIDSNAKLFYSGINWERIANKKGRHHDLFKGLDEENMTKIYGPEKFFEAIPWEGFKTYQGSLPFDGISAIKAINDCGMSLVITSDTHREAEAATNRLYESCAAGAVIISDDNAFVENEFGDSVLYFKYHKEDNNKNLEQIKELVLWINENKLEALELAQKSQDIYIQKFKQEDVLQNLINKHQERKSEVERLTLDTSTEISVILRCLKYNKSFEETALSLNNQINKNNIKLKILFNDKDNDKIVQLVSKLDSKIEKQLIPLEIYKNEKRVLTSGEVLYAGLKTVDTKYIAILDAGYIWYKEHLSLLLKEITSSSNNINLSYTGINHENILYEEEGKKIVERKKIFFSNIDDAMVYHFSTALTLTSFVFDIKILKRIKNSSFITVDGYEAYLIMLKSIEYGNKSFSKKSTMTISVVNHIDYSNHIENIIDIEWQKRTIRDTIIFSDSINTKLLSQGNPVIPEIDQHSVEVALKNFLKNKIGHKYPRTLKGIKKIYNKVTK